MKRFIKEYADYISKEIARRIAILDDPRKWSIYSREATEKASEELKNLLFYAERGLITESETMRTLAAIDPRNN